MRHISVLERPPASERPHSVADAAEQLIASLALSVVCARLLDGGGARVHIKQAHDTLKRLPTHPQTIRPARLMKLARLKMNVGHEQATTFLPIFDDVLLDPATDRWPLGIRAGTPACGNGVWGLLDVDIAYYRIRLRTGRLTSALRILAEMDSPEGLECAAREIITQCIYDEIRPVAPLDIADDYFTLAANYARYDNIPLARLALSKASDTLHSYSISGRALNHQHRIQLLMDQIAGLTASLISMAS